MGMTGLFQMSRSELQLCVLEHEPAIAAAEARVRAEYAPLLAAAHYLLAQLAPECGCSLCEHLRASGLHTAVCRQQGVMALGTGWGRGWYG